MKGRSRVDHNAVSELFGSKKERDRDNADNYNEKGPHNETFEIRRTNREEFMY